MVELKLILDPKTGQLQVFGPVHDKILCYGMLALAQDAIRDCNSKSPEQRPNILLARGQLPPINGA